VQRLRAVGPFIARVVEWKGPCGSLQRIVGQPRFDMLQGDHAVESKPSRRAIEIRDRDGVVEHIMQPVQIRRLRRDVQARPDEAEIMAFARAEHHPMLTQFHRLRIVIRREVTHRQHARGKLLNAINT
jgi:hypothetical protein